MTKLQSSPAQADSAYQLLDKDGRCRRNDDYPAFIKMLKSQTINKRLSHLFGENIA